MRTSKRILSIILSILTIFNIMSCAVSVWAAEYNEPQSEDYMVGSSDEQLSDDAEIEEVTREVVEKREEYSKTYIHPNGSYTKVYSQTPIHMFEEGLWVDIDNTMAYEGGYLKNTDGLFDVEFPEVISEDSQIILNNNGETIAFSVNGVGAVEAMVTAPEVDETNVIEYDLSKTVSEITYENVSEHTDIQYVVSSDFVKENIIVSDKSGIQDTYSFDIEKGNLNAVFDDNNNLNFVNEANEVIFTIPAPVMTDAKGSVSYDIDVAVENAEQAVLTLIYTPSEEWLNSSERAYPVVIDPVIGLPDMNDTVVEDTVIYNDFSDAESKLTNYSDSVMGVLGDSQLVHSEILVKINLDTFSFCNNSNIEVTDVNYFCAGYVNGGNALVKPISGSWDNSTIVYDDVYPTDGSTPVITYEDKIVDYFTGYPGDEETAVTVHFNITELFREWLSGERANNGFAIVPENENTTGFLYLAGEHTISSNSYTFNTYCSIDYIDASGKNDVYECLTQEVGRAGSVNVNTFTRGLSAYRYDLGMSGNVMPVDIGFNYGGAFDNFFALYKNLIEVNGDEADIHIPYGKGWLPSYLRAIFQVAANQYQVFVGDGTVAVFNSEYKTVDGVTTLQFYEDYTSTATGYELKLIDQSLGECTDNMVLISPSGEKTYFNEAGFITEIHEAEANTDGTYDKITVALDSDNLLCVDYITDGVGRKYDFVYDSESDLLSRIECLTAAGEQINAGTTQKSLSVSYAYNSYGNLIEVMYPDDKYIRYDYENNNLVKATNIDGYGIEYTYDSLDKVTMITEYSGSVTGNSIMLVPMGNRQVKIIDAYSGTEIHQFGKDGRLHYIFDDKGNYYKTESAPATDDSIITSFDWRVTPENLLKNGGFEKLTDGKPDNWNNAFTVAEIEESGFACVVDGTAQQSQTVSVDGGKAYTFSVSAKSSEEDSVLDIQITAVTAQGTSTVESEKIYPTDEYKQYSVTVLSDNEISAVTVSIGGENTTGTIYVDNAQLESGKGIADFNYIENGGFEYVTDNAPENWTDATVTAHTINGESVNAVVLEGGLPYYSTSENVQTLTDYKSEVSQRVEINGKKGDVYSVGGWFNGFFDDNYINPTFIVEHSSTTDQLTESRAYIEVSYQYTSATADADGNEALEEMSETFTVDFAPHNDNWQYAVDSFALKGDVEYIDIKVISKNIPTTSYATNISVTKDNDCALFRFDESEDIYIDQSDSTTQEMDRCCCDGCEEFECSCRCTSTEECICIQCKRRGNIEEISDDETLITTKLYDGYKYIRSSSYYSNDLNNLISETDTNGILTKYAYNNNGEIVSSTDSTETTTTYELNPMGYLSIAEVSVSEFTDDEVSAVIEYVYDGDLLEIINEKDVQYTYSYNIWSQLESISIDGNRIVSYNYGEGENRSRLKSVVFGSSLEECFVVEYFYTGDKITCVKKCGVDDGTDDAIVYNYEYDNLGNLIHIYDNATGRRISYTDNGFVVTYSDSGQIIYEVSNITPNSESYSGDDIIIPESVKTETAYTVSYTQNVYESKYDELTGKTTAYEAIVGGKTIGMQTVSDWFGRKDSAIVMTKNPLDINSPDFTSIVSTYQYKTSNDITTYLISEMNNTITGSDSVIANYSYTYDANGRIVGINCISGISSLSGSTVYSYDELGQLISESDGTKTYKYYYNSTGNITARQMYVGAILVDTDYFEYTEDSWEDRLLQYNNQTFSYDEIGNPINYMGAALSWRGRELESYTKGDKEIFFGYDVDGMRYQKIVKVNSIETERYDYMYSDEKLILLSHTENGTTNTARYIYDSFGELRGLILNNNSTYLYLKNAHGDVVGLVDELGNVVLTYSYNAWGAVNFNTTSMQYMELASILSDVNPFTYRGYCYDYDIGMYYLQSRYYDPEICRFINADNTDYLGATETLLSYNLFAYCENDPVNFADCDGEKKQSANKTTLEKYLKTEYKCKKTEWGNKRVKIKVTGNSIVISANFEIKGDLANKYVNAYSYANWFIHGISKHWKGSFKVFNGISVTLKTYATQYYSSHVSVNLKNATGISNTQSANRWQWYRGKDCKITIYKTDSRDNNWYDGEEFAWVAAHEFGHLLGAADQGNYTQYTIMGKFKEKLTSDDIERVLAAFIKNRYGAEF